MIILFVLYFLLFLVPVILIIYSVFCLLGDFLGAPYVPTNSKMVMEILEKAQFKKNQVFIELGSGDGRVVRAAAQKYQVKGVGVEIHPLLIFYSRFVSKLKGIGNVQFIQGNFFNMNLSAANVIFLFLLPKTLEKLKLKILKDCQKGTLIIAHGFKIKGWNSKLEYKINRPLFPTYFYRL